MRLSLLVPSASLRGPGSAGCVAAALVLAAGVPARAAPAPAGDPSSAPEPDAPYEPQETAVATGDEGANDALAPATGSNEPAGSDDSTTEDAAGSEAAATAPRPELPPPMDLPTEPPWQRHLELGAAVAYVSRPLFHDRPANATSYRPGVGFAVLLHWDLLSFLRFSPYFYNVSHALVLPPGSLSTAGAKTVSRGATFSETSVSTFAFGAKLDPTLWLDERLKLWITAGVGWGRMFVPELTVTDPLHGEYVVGERSSVFVEFPIGLGAGVDLIERWLSLEYQVTATPLSGQSGSALEHVQAVDSTGQLLDVGPVEELDVTFVHTLGLTLIL